ncbi:MAG: FAD-dependent oxidoreductase [Candidatus Omnitrophota bacterium]
MKIYDLIIVGAGPAGMTAAVYAARKRLEFLIISRDIGGQLSWSGDVENYTGYQFITGPELTLKFEEHIRRFKVNMHMPETVKELIQEGKSIKAVSDKSEYICRTVIVASGKRPRPLNVKGEKEFRNKGVTYCATCDGPLFADKPVAIIGGGNSALDAALQMVKISPKVHIVNNAQNFTADAIMADKLKESPVAQIWNNATVQKIYGDNFVRGIELEKDKKRYDLKVEGVFIEIGLIANTDGLDILKKNEDSEIIVDCHNRTNVAGIFAAGDVSNVPDKQVIVACGEGAKATLAAFRYLSTHTF